MFTSVIVCIAVVPRSPKVCLGSKGHLQGLARESAGAQWCWC